MHDTHIRFIEENFQEAVNEAEKRRTEALEENKMLEKKCAFYEKEVTEARKHLQDLVKSMEKATGA